MNLTPELYLGHDRLLYLDTTKFKIFKRKMIAYLVFAKSKLGHEVLSLPTSKNKA
jgi:hypothetical protein